MAIQGKDRTGNAPDRRRAGGKTSGLAVASLVCGLLGPLTCGLGAIVGLILGIVGLMRIRQSGGALGGEGLAVAGIVVSGASLVIGAALGLPVLGMLILFRNEARESVHDIWQDAREAPEEDIDEFFEERLPPGLRGTGSVRTSFRPTPHGSAARRPPGITGHRRKP
jgi:hypothetical protein